MDLIERQRSNAKVRRDVEEKHLRALMQKDIDKQVGNLIHDILIQASSAHDRWGADAANDVISNAIIELHSYLGKFIDRDEDFGDEDEETK